jgi:hypothetical protein
MADLFVTFISVQPAVAVRSTARAQQQNKPQATGATRAGLYESKRQKQVVRIKTAPPGAK